MFETDNDIVYFWFLVVVLLSLSEYICVSLVMRSEFTLAREMGHHRNDHYHHHHHHHYCYYSLIQGNQVVVGLSSVHAPLQALMHLLC